MRVLMLPDADLLSRERAMLQRVEIGLADEGARVLHATPGSLHAGDPADTAQVYSTPINWHDRGLPFTLALRASSLVQAVEAAAPVDGTIAGEHLVDVVYAVGESAWPMALLVSRRLRAPAVLEVWHPGLIARAGQVWKREGEAPAGGRGGPGARGPRPFFIAAGAALGDRLLRALPAERAAVVPWGVHPGDAERPALDPSTSLTIALLCSGDDPAAAQAAIEALGLVAQRYPGLLVFVDAGLCRRLPVWRWAGAGSPGGLPERLSVIADLESNRELILQADVLLLPEAGGAQHTLPLDAMASGCLVVAREDPLAEHLQHGRTCVCASGASPQALAKAVLDLVADPTAEKALRRSAWEFIVQQRTASHQVQALWKSLERAVQGA